MIDFKKQLEKAELMNKDYVDIIKQISIANAVKNSLYTNIYETLSGDKFTDEEFNKICKYIYLFPSIVDVEIITDTVLKTFVVDEQDEDVPSLSLAAFSLSDLDSKTRRQELFEFVIDYICENVEIETMMFYDFTNRFDKIN